MGYDRYPELVIDEKKQLLDRIMAEDGWAFYTHDAEASISKIAINEKGKYHAIDARADLLNFL